MSYLFKILFYQPIFNLLMALVLVMPGHDIGLAIVLLTIIVRLILWPLSARALRSQRALQEVQPKIEDLKKKYATDKEELGRRLMTLYKEEKVNPASSCLPLLLQLPVFIALYSALSHGLESSGFEALYSFVPNPGTIDSKLFGLLDLSASNPVLAVLSGISQYFQARMTITRPKPDSVPGSEDERMLVAMNKNMLYMMPVMTTFIAWKLPGGLGLYWLVTNLISIIQQAIILKKSPFADFKKKPTAPVAPAKS